jgi:hypothetical protein
LPYATLEGYGLYAVTIYFRRIDSDDGTDDSVPEESEETWEKPSLEMEETGNAILPWDPEEPGWVFGAVDYFYVVNP